MPPNNKTGHAKLVALFNITPADAPATVHSAFSGTRGNNLCKTPAAGNVFRPGPDDLNSVVELEKQSFALPWSLAEYQQALQNQTFGLLGLKQDEHLVAYVSFYILQDELEIVNLATSVDTRRKGYARTLLAALFEHAASQGVARIVLEVNSRNTPARNLYVNMGFKRIGLRKGYYNHGRDDALIYELGLKNSALP